MLTLKSGDKTRLEEREERVTMKSRYRKFFDKIETSRNLPSLPHILVKLIEACNSEPDTIKEISKIINKDVSLSARLLRLVNSVYYGLPTRVTGVDHALLLLGTNAVKNIAISASVFQAFDQAKDSSVFRLKLFWWHSLMCATLGKLIAVKTSYPAPDEAFLSGLLHDIGLEGSEENKDSKLNVEDYPIQVKEEGTGNKEIFDQFKLIEYFFERYIVKIVLTPSNKFLGIIEVKVNKDFRSYEQKIRSQVYHDEDELYQDENAV